MRFVWFWYTFNDGVCGSVFRVPARRSKFNTRITWWVNVSVCTWIFGTLVYGGGLNFCVFVLHRVMEVVLYV